MGNYNSLRPHAVVVGGGFAGASAASALTEAGVAVTLIEERATLGGRARSLKDGVTRQEVDNGQHLFLGAYQDTLRFLRRMGVDQRVKFVRGLNFTFVNRRGRRSQLAARGWPGTAGLLAGLLTFREMSFGNRLSLVFGLARARWTKPEQVAKITVAQWLTELGQTAGSRRGFWEPLCLATLNETVDRAAAAAFLDVLNQGLLASSGKRRLGFSTVPLSRLWPVALAPYLERTEGQVALRQRVVGVEMEKRRVLGVRLEGGALLEADLFILAVPLSAAMRLLPDGTVGGRDVLAGNEFSPIVGINLWYDQLPFDDAMVGLLDMDVQWLFNRKTLWGPSGEGQLTAVISAARALEGTKTSAELVQMARGDVQRAFPYFTGRFQHGSVVWEPQATPSPTPEFYARRPSVETGLENLFLAGDWVNVGLPPTIEAACRSGHRAAERALATWVGQKECSRC